jgi:hypothetical protein
MDAKVELSIEKAIMKSHYCSMSNDPEEKKKIQVIKQKCADDIGPPYESCCISRTVMNPILVKQKKKEDLTEYEQFNLRMYRGLFIEDIFKLVALHLATDAELKAWKEKHPNTLTCNLASRMIRWEPTMMDRMLAFVDQLNQELAKLAKYHDEDYAPGGSNANCISTPEPETIIPKPSESVMMAMPVVRPYEKERRMEAIMRQKTFDDASIEELRSLVTKDKLSPDDLLFHAAHIGNIKLCELAKELGSLDYEYMAVGALTSKDHKNFVDIARQWMAEREKAAGTPYKVRIYCQDQQEAEKLRKKIIGVIEFDYQLSVLNKYTLKMLEHPPEITLEKVDEFPNRHLEAGLHILYKHKLPADWKDKYHTSNAVQLNDSCDVASWVISRLMSRADIMCPDKE